MKKRTHFKLRKVKKQWITVAVTSATLGAGLLTFWQAEAEEMTSPSSPQQAQVRQNISPQISENTDNLLDTPENHLAEPEHQDETISQAPFETDKNSHQEESNPSQGKQENPVERKDTDKEQAKKGEATAEKEANNQSDTEITQPKTEQASQNKEAEKKEQNDPIIDPPKNQFVTDKQGHTFYYDEKGENPQGLFEVDGKKYYQDRYSGIYKNQLALTGYEGATYYFGQDGHPITNQWWEEEFYPRNRYYFGPDGKALKHWQTFDGHKVYFDDYGVLVRGSYRIDGKKYAFEKDTGYLITNRFFQYAPSNDWYYLNELGQFVNGYQTIDGKKYYFNDNGLQLKGLGFDSKQKLLYTDPNTGEINTNPLQTNRFYTNQSGQWFYITTNGELAKGLQIINGKKYYFSASGFQAKDQLVEIDGKKYYFAPDTGEMVEDRFAGIKSRNNYGSYIAWYYFGPDGAALTGEQTINGKQLEFYRSGEQIKGKLIDDGDSFRYYDTYTGEVVKNEFRYVGIGNNYTYSPYFYGWYYFDENGRAVIGWKEVDGKLLYFAKGPNPDLKYDYYHQKGGQIKGELWKIDGKLYYFDEWTGEKVTNRIVYYRESDYIIDGDGIATKSDKDFDEEMPPNAKNQFYLSPKGYYYYLEDDGKPVTGWQIINGRKIYFNERGRQIKNELKFIDGHYYYLDDKEGEAQANLLVSYVKGNGEKIQVYLKEDGSLASGWLTTNDNTYYFDSNSSPYPALVTGQLKEIDGKSYCFGNSGALLKNQTFNLKGKKYKADEKGVVTLIEP